MPSKRTTSGPSRARSRATTRTGNFPTPTRREVKRASGGLALAALVAACSGGIVPQGAGPSSAGSSATPPRIDYNVPVRQPTPSTPIAPVAAATVAGATTAITAGLAAGPAVTAARPAEIGRAHV